MGLQKSDARRTKEIVQIHDTNVSKLLISKLFYSFSKTMKHSSAHVSAAYHGMLMPY